MLTCKQASQLISQSLDHPLSFPNRFKLRLHLVLCDACCRFKRQLNQLRNALQQLCQGTEVDDTITLSAQAKVRIIDSVASKHP